MTRETADAGNREIACAALLGLYSHIATAEAILDGMPPREAGQASADLYFRQLAEMYLTQVFAADPTQNWLRVIGKDILWNDNRRVRARRHEPFPPSGPLKHWTTGCLQESLTAELGVL